VTVPVTLVQHVTRPFHVLSPWPGEEFALLLVVRARDVAPDEQMLLSRQIVDSGCRYAACTGVDSSSWDDSIDQAVVEAGLDGRRSESRTVMTTWHEKETLEEVIAFFLSHTAFEDFTPSRRLALQVGGTHDERLTLEGLLHAGGSGRTRR
jgi:hypothetical protein